MAFILNKLKNYLVNLHVTIICVCVCVFVCVFELSRPRVCMIIYVEIPAYFHFKFTIKYLISGDDMRLSSTLQRVLIVCLYGTCDINNNEH